jgi:hypothetical protein
MRLLAKAPAVSVLAWAAAAAAQAPAEAAGPAGTAPSTAVASMSDPPTPHPIFGVATLSAEAGTYYLGGAKLALLGNPFPSGVSFGGSVFLGPLTNLQQNCAPPCKTDPLVWRWMTELRLGTAYSDDARSLEWFGLSGGVSYLTEPGGDLGPVISVAGGGDIRVAKSLWLELVLRFTWAQILGPDSSFAAPYVTFGIELGMRVDIAR